MARENYHLIKRPILTEKARNLSKEGIYIFEVAKDANKKEIKKAVEEMFGVEVEKVRTIKIPAKKRIWRGVLGKKKSIKKAMVKLKKGQRIEIFE